MQIIQQYTNSPLRNFQYILCDDSSHQAICIDPYDVNLIQEAFSKHDLELKAIFNTHEHKDHTHGNEELAHLSKEGIWVHPLSLDTIPKATMPIDNNQRLVMGDIELEFLYTPGHTASSITLVGRKEKTIQFIITGDTLFNAGVGNCYRGGDPSILYDTIASMYRYFPDSTLVYPGHDYWQNNLQFTKNIMPNNQFVEDALGQYEELLAQGQFLISNLGLERKISTFFQLNHPELRIKLQDSMLRKTEKEIFIELRKLRDSF